ncbi:MAG: RMD1 family protein [Sphingobacteriales bacterium]|nr:RMD1 family protein [Sphingobacteriales bacterium]
MAYLTAMLPVVSYQIADSIDVKSFKTTFSEGIYHSDADELFYKMGPESYVYVFKYGVVCFLNVDEHTCNLFLDKIAPYCKNPFEQHLSEEFQIETDAKENKFGYNKIEITGADTDTLRLIMLNVSQSVALDYYSEQTNRLLEETNSHTQSLERRGRLAISGMNLKKYIGKTLNLKNRISENLYIFDSPPETWEDENLNKIDLGLKRTFDLQERFRDIKEGLEIIRENLELFKDLLQYRNSTVLEWIIIVLVAAEVINILLEKLFKI